MLPLVPESNVLQSRGHTKAPLAVFAGGNGESATLSDLASSLAQTPFHRGNGESATLSDLASSLAQTRLRLCPYTDLMVSELPANLSGTLHIHVAFDWGDEIDLPRVAAIQGAGGQPLPRRRRTPSSFEYRPLPVRLGLEAVPIELAEVGAIKAPGEATLFDFGAVSIALHVPFALSPAGLTHLAGFLADPTPAVRAARLAAEPLFQRLLPAIEDPLWSDLSEEYFVFQLPLDCGLPPPSELLRSHAGWLAGLVGLESSPLSAEATAEALRLHLSYSPDDLFVTDWAAALLLDKDCDETLQAIEFANLQLLEYRHIDQRLDDALANAYRIIHRLTRSRLPFWKTHGRPLRALGELKVEATGLFERTGNVLKLVGDQYLARVYQLSETRFHLNEWEQSIQRKLDVLEGIYQVLSDQAATFRAEFLEWTVIVLIALEIVLALTRH
jgi:hypothetical protein